MRTNAVFAEEADGSQRCLYVGTSADEALRLYGLLKERGGKWLFVGSAHANQFVKAALFIDPRTTKHCSFAG